MYRVVWVKRLFFKYFSECKLDRKHLVLSFGPVHKSRHPQRGRNAIIKQRQIET